MMGSPRPVISNLAKDALRLTTGACARTVSGPPRKFIIFTNGRTGSNLLVSLLRAHPDIRVHSEIFGEYQLEDRLNRRLIRLSGERRHLRKAFMPLAFEKAVGLKMLYYQITKAYGERRGVPDIEAVRSEIQSDEHLRFFHLKRKDRLARIISNRLALASGNWERGGYSRIPIEIDVGWARSELERMISWENEFDDWLPADRTLEILYEDLAGDAEPVMHAAFEFIGVKPRKVSSGLRKQATRPPHEMVSNFGELRDELSRVEDEIKSGARSPVTEPRRSGRD